MGVYIIAEVGVNHNGNMDIAKRLIEEAAKAGCDAVKFQTFKTERLVTGKAQKAHYQIENTGNGESQFQMLKRLEFGPAQFAELKAHCAVAGIEFCPLLSTKNQLICSRVLALLVIKLGQAI